MSVFYAIGDIHGMYDKLIELHSLIEEDIKKNNIDQPILVHLGDYIDRGPASKEVVSFVRKSESNPLFKCVNLKGNHEQLMIDAYDYGRQEVHVWIMNGGDETLTSYGNPDYNNRPVEDIEWMRYLPYYYRDDQNKILFVHAGIMIHEFPNLRQDVCLWTRNNIFFDDERWANPNLKDWLIVHGHSVVSKKHATVHKQRINLDTGSCFGGKLSAAKIEMLPNFERNVTIFQV